MECIERAMIVSVHGAATMANHVPRTYVISSEYITLENDR